MTNIINKSFGFHNILIFFYMYLSILAFYCFYLNVTDRRLS